MTDGLGEILDKLIILSGIVSTIVATIYGRRKSRQTQDALEERDEVVHAVKQTTLLNTDEVVKALEALDTKDTDVTTRLRRSRLVKELQESGDGV